MLLVGCGFDPPAQQLVASTATPDGGSDSCASLTEQFATCSLGSGSDLSITSSATYDTETGTLRIGAQVVPVNQQRVHASGGVEVDALVVGSFELSATLTVVGELPLALIASRDVMIGGELYVTPGLAGARGPCDATDGADSTEGGGGGGGGAFRGIGGGGGTGSGGVIAGGGGGAAQPLPTTLVGGCAGANGGVGAGPGGVGGVGGGVVLIATAGTIAIMPGGGIAVNGGGGQISNASKGGGGGGGAGGLAVLEATSVVNQGYVVANGGGGAEGENNAGNAANAGSDGTSTAMPAKGGAGGTSDGGDGGSGGAGPAIAGVTATDSQRDGGGGGGGGVGYIGVTRAAPGPGLYSPGATTWP